MAKKYKLVALDMDGTVLNEKREISPANKKAIEQALNKGVIVSFATGRGYQSIEPYIHELNLNTPIVAVNGSEVWKKPKELLKRNLIESKVIQELHEVAVHYDTWFWGYAVEGLFNKEQWADNLDDYQWLKYGFYTEDDNKIREINNLIHSWGTLEITNSHPNNIELNPLGVSKASGLQALCEWKGFEMSDVITMGDSLNDLAMIRAAGLGVAMGNAQEVVKQEADVITLANDEDGVAKIIEEYVLAT
ncbi:Cof-type HAD-IIB family hydrolase [Chengkuizengella axinellae]|uniref:Cof-type HAD-IIB family hydrolase n=1 Tax=Chengkuizengella axinellae TaxID=3064388 RepID=A0ABT9IT73_9BACL|nr:Cof-type HAD-IIB family hydrolase [Chengkuizengella sp. 2205SS18-9]MDP5272560.1 Cof-type HAD-IIB family hydrolase [Chengkuizengella sp. 2205SS18-9]